MDTLLLIVNLIIVAVVGGIAYLSYFMATRRLARTSAVMITLFICAAIIHVGLTRDHDQTFMPVLALVYAVAYIAWIRSITAMTRQR